MDSQGFRYWAFVSYSSADSKTCKKLHKALEQYKVPAPLVGKDSRGEPTPTKIFPVFRDRDEFPLNANLGSSIENALELSRYLIVLCSKTAAKSQWVNEEIRYFKSLGREDRVLAIIVDGEPNSSDIEGNEHNECFPKALRYALDSEGQISESRVEPIAGDLRANGDGWNKAFLKCVAGILGVGLDEIIQRDKVAQAKRKRFQLAGIVLFSVLFLGYFSANESANRSTAISESLKSSILCEDVTHSDLANAAVIGDYDGVVDALANGDDINEKSCERGTTVLQKTIMAGHSNMVDLLLEKGADPYLDDSTGFIAIHYAAMSGKANIPEIFVKYGLALNEPVKIMTGNYLTTLQLAIRVGKFEVVKKLIELGVPIVRPHDKKIRGLFHSALTDAAAANEVEITKYFLEQGADPYFVDPLNSKTTTTPKKMAEQAGAKDVLALFAKYDKDNDIKPSQDELNASLVRTANPWNNVTKVKLEVIRDLINRGANPFGNASVRGSDAITMTIVKINMYCYGDDHKEPKQCERYMEFLSIFLENGVDSEWLSRERGVLQLRFEKSGQELKDLFIQAGVDVESIMRQK